MPYVTGENWWGQLKFSEPDTQRPSLSGANLDSQTHETPLMAQVGGMHWHTVCKKTHCFCIITSCQMTYWLRSFFKLYYLIPLQIPLSRHGEKSISSSQTSVWRSGWTKRSHCSDLDKYIMTIKNRYTLFQAKADLRTAQNPSRLRRKSAIVCPFAHTNAICQKRCFNPT